MLFSVRSVFIKALCSPRLGLQSAFQLLSPGSFWSEVSTNLLVRG
ncbi:hypothetical protein Hanom_Chr15g01340461 [Helianthus anomalus]